MKKYLASILAVLLLFASVGEVFAEGEGTGEEIKTFGQVLQEVGLIKGDGTGLNPQGQLTREELVTIVNRLYREKAPEYILEIHIDEYTDFGSPESPTSRDAPTEEYRTFVPPEKPTFADVPKNHWAYKDVEFAYAKGISKGISASEFGLGEKVNANQAALFLVRIMGYNDKIMEEKIDYKEAYRKVFLLLDIKASHVKDPFAPLLRGDVFQMVYDGLWAKTPHGKTPEGILFVYEVFGQETEMWWKIEKILGGDSYFYYFEMHDIIPTEDTYHASFIPIFKTKEELFADYIDFEPNKITKTFDMAYFGNLKSYLLDLNITDERQSWDYTNAMLIQILKRANNIFVETIEGITSDEMQETSWKELKNLLGNEVSFDLDMWAPYRGSEGEHSYLHPYNANGLVIIDTSKASLEFTYDKPAEEGMDWEFDTYLYEIKSIQTDKKTQSKFVFRIRTADDQYQDLDLFFVFEYDSDSEMVVKAASSNNMGFGTLNQDYLMGYY